MDIRTYIQPKLRTGVKVIIDFGGGLFEVVDIDDYTVTILDCGTEDVISISAIEKIMTVDEIMSVERVVVQQKPKYV